MWSSRTQLVCPGGHISTAAGKTCPLSTILQFNNLIYWLNNAKHHPTNLLEIHNESIRHHIYGQNRGSDMTSPVFCSSELFHPLHTNTEPPVVHSLKALHLIVMFINCGPETCSDSVFELWQASQCINGWALSFIFPGNTSVLEKLQGLLELSFLKLALDLDIQGDILQQWWH